MEFYPADIEMLMSGWNSLYFVNDSFPNLKRENVNFRHWVTQATFWVQMGNSICHNGPKAASKFENVHIS
jgi:hypothetical protein